MSRATGPTSVVGVCRQSSLTIVPVPAASARPALVGWLRLTVQVSLASLTVSPPIGTTIVQLVLPAAMVSVPVLVVKSPGALAVPAVVTYLTVTGEVDAADIVTLKVMLAVAESGSLSDTSLIASIGLALPW